MTPVDGLEDGRWMIATKTHHAMIDGVGWIDIGHILLDAEPHPGSPPPSRRRQMDRTGAARTCRTGFRRRWLPGSRARGSIPHVTRASSCTPVRPPWR
jgi:Wax ester synthase-like Acyl-CoA acyltransferase domain